MNQFFNSKNLHFFAAALLGLLSFFATSQASTATPEVSRMIGVAVCIIYLWLTEPVSVLLSIVLLPAFDLLSLKEATTPYANPVIFLFLGGFIIAKGLEKYLITGPLTVAQMMRAGAVMNLISILVIWLLGVRLIGWVF